MKKRIFVVDDEKDILELFKEFFETEENEIFVFEDHNEAIKASQELKPDLIILDANLRGTSGLQIVSNFYKESKKYLFSGHNFQTTPEGFSGVLGKPFDMQQMVDLLS